MFANHCASYDICYGVYLHQLVIIYSHGISCKEGVAAGERYCREICICRKLFRHHLALKLKLKLFTAPQHASGGCSTYGPAQSGLDAAILVMGFRSQSLALVS